MIKFNSQNQPIISGEYAIAPACGQEYGWFARSAVSVIAGASGSGKTTLLFDMLHRQKQGTRFLDHHTFKYGFHVVAYDTGWPAFRRMVSQLGLRDVEIPTTLLPPTIGTLAIQKIVNVIEGLHPIPEIIAVDNLDLFMGGDNKVSMLSFIGELREVAEHFRIALIGTVGVPKGRGIDDLWKRTCNTAAVLEFEKDDKRQLTVNLHNAPTEIFALQFMGGRLVPMQAEPEVSNERLRRAEEFLKRELQRGPRNSKELIQCAHEMENIGRNTLYEAAQRLHVVRDSGMRVHGGSAWYLPDAETLESNGVLADWTEK